MLQLVAWGYTTREIEGFLEIELYTVRTHRATILRKLKEPHMAGAVGKAMREGWIQ